MTKNSIDTLFEEREKDKKSIPEDVVEAIKEIVKRNDEFPTGSSRRVSLQRTIKFIELEFNYKITRGQIDKLSQQIGRKSWGHE